jgi:hypothetical protein
MLRAAKAFGIIVLVLATILVAGRVLVEVFAHRHGITPRRTAPVSDLPGETSSPAPLESASPSPEALAPGAEKPPTSLRIRVLDESGNPAADARLTVEAPAATLRLLDDILPELAADFAPWREQFGKVLEVPSSGVVEWKSLSPLLAGMPYLVRATAPGMVPGDVTSFRLEKGALVSLDLVVFQPRSLEVIVLDAETDSPLEGAVAAAEAEAKRRGLGIGSPTRAGTPTSTASARANSKSW